MKKILVFSLAYYPYASGAEEAIKEIANRISDIEFHILTLRFDVASAAEEKIGNVFIYRIGNASYVQKIFFPFIAALTARSLHTKHQFNAIWAMMTYMLLPTMLTKWLGVRVPHLLTLQDGDPYEKVFGRLRIVPFLPIIDAGFRSARIIQAISTYLAGWPKKRGYQGVVELIHNGANPHDLEEYFDQKEIEELKHALGKKKGDIFLVNTARLEYQKAQDDVIRALPLLPDNVKFLIVGRGSEEQMLRDLSDSLSLQKRVIFTGFIDREEVTKYRKAADIFTAPSRSEGLGNAFLSAMASRLPVVATQEGGLAEFIFDEKRNPDKPTTAWAVDKNAPEQIASAVKDILSNPDKVRTVIEIARTMVLEKFNWDMIAQQMRTRVFAKVL